MPFVDLKDLPPMDYIFQDETTSVRKGINQIMKKQKLEIIPKMVVTSSTLALQAAEEWNWVLYCCGRASDLYQPWRSSAGISDQRTGGFQCRRGLASQ